MSDYENIIEVAALRMAAVDAFNDKSLQGLQRALVGNWLRNRANQIEEEAAS